MDIRLFAKSVMIFWALLFAIISLTLALPSHAVDIEVGTGVTHFKHQHDGVWYQDAFPNSFDLKSVPMSLGIAFEGKNTLWRAEFLSLGSMFNKAQITTDAMYYPGTSVSPHVTLDGRGSVSGVILSAVRPIRLFGLPFYGEAGIYAFKHKWNVSVHDMKGNHLLEMQREPELNFGPVLGFGIRGKGIDVGIRYLYLDAAGGEGTSAMPPLATHAYTGMIKVYF